MVVRYPHSALRTITTASTGLMFLVLGIPMVVLAQNVQPNAAEKTMVAAPEQIDFLGITNPERLTAASKRA